MDGSSFDKWTLRIASKLDRRSFLKAAAASTIPALAVTRMAPAVVSAQNNDECAAFCQQLPAQERGLCVADAAHGDGLCYECGPLAPAGSPLELCGQTCIDTSNDPLNCGGCGQTCGSRSTCVNGDCQCWAGYAVCETTGTCVSTWCGVHKVFNPATCQCECEPQYVPIVNTGACALPCETDADCGSTAGGCKTTPEGQKLCGVCGESGWTGCTDHYPCTSSGFCQSCASAWNAFCSLDDGHCYSGCTLW